MRHWTFIRVCFGIYSISVYLQPTYTTTILNDGEIIIYCAVVIHGITKVVMAAFVFHLL